MDITAVVNSEGLQFQTVLGSHRLGFSSQESPANGSVDLKGDDCLHETPNIILLEPDQDICKLKENFSHACHNSSDFGETGQVSIIAGEDSQHHEVSTNSIGDDSATVSLPDPIGEGESDQVVWHHPVHMTDLDYGGVKSTDHFSNGHIVTTPDEQISIVVSTPSPDAGQKTPDLPRIIKHKPSSITFSDYTDRHAFINESSEDGQSSQEEEEEEDEEDDRDNGDDDDDEDVFPELPQCKELLVNHRDRCSRDRQKRRGGVSGRAQISHSSSNSDYDAEGETSRKEESPQVKSPWSESMSQLMRKLDQLNLDIEEALSASSSPCDTPCTNRKKQWGAATKSTVHQTLNDQALPKPEKGGCLNQDRSSGPRSASVGTRTRTKKTVCSKMTNPAGAAGLRRALL